MSQIKDSSKKYARVQIPPPTLELHSNLSRDLNTVEMHTSRTRFKFVIADKIFDMHVLL